MNILYYLVCMQKVSNDKMVISIKNISKIRYNILEYIDIEGTIDSVLKYHQLEPHHLVGPITQCLSWSLSQLEPTWPRSSVGRALPLD